MSGSRDLPAIEGMGGMSLGMSRRAFSYDDNLEAPMSTPTADNRINNLWRRPIIPERKFSNLSEEGGAVVSSSQTAVSDTAPTRSPAVVKTNASSIIMSSLITKQTHDSMYSFEQKAGLTDTSYTPHQGLTADDTAVYHHRMPDSFQKMQIQSMEVKEEKQTSSAQSTPSNTPQSSPKQNRSRSWFSSTGSDLSLASNASGDSGADGAAAGGGVVERWGVFGPRPQDHKSTSDLGSESTTTAGFALQAYRGAQKPSAMEVMKAQATRLADDKKAAPPIMEIPAVEARKKRPHKLKPRDMNILAPSGF